MRHTVTSLSHPSHSYQPSPSSSTGYQSFPSITQLPDFPIRYSVTSLSHAHTVPAFPSATHEPTCPIRHPVTSLSHPPHSYQPYPSQSSLPAFKIRYTVIFQQEFNFFCGLECVGHSLDYVVHFERCLDSKPESCRSEQAR
jgi:hypothetical protein